MTVEPAPIFPDEEWWAVADGRQIMAYVAYLWTDSASRIAEQSTLAEYVKAQCGGD